MRWFNCALLAVLVVLSSAQDNDQRPKRDLSLIKDLLIGTFFGKTEDPAPIFLRDRARIYKIQGAKGVFVKSVPKAAVKVESTEVGADETAILKANPRIALVSSYLGTKTLNDTLVSLTTIKKLLQSGVLQTQEDIDKVAPPSIFFDSSKTYNEAITSTYPSTQYVIPPYTDCCKSGELQKHSFKPGKDASNLMASGKNIVRTESVLPVQLSPYIISQSEFPIVSEDIHLAQSPVIYDVPVSVNPYTSTSLNIAPETIPEGYIYSNIYNDDILTTYTGLQHETGPVVVQKTKNPHLVPDFIVDRIENAAAQAHKVSGSKLTKNFYSTYSPGYPFVLQNQGYVYEQPKKEVDILIGNTLARNIPSEYSYTTVHKNGVSTTYTDSGEVKHTISTNPHQNSIDGLKRDNNVVVVQNIQKAHPLPGFIAKRIENIAGSTCKKSLSKLSVHAPHAIQTIQDLHTIYGPPREQVKITVGSPIPVNGGYSYTTTYKDSAVASHSNSDTTKESTQYYFKGNNNNVISDRDHKIKVTLVEKPTPLPTFIADRFENALVAATNVKIPRHEVVEEAAYVTTIPIYERLNPVILQSPSKLEGVVTDNIPKSPELPKDSSQYSYTTIHKDGTRTTFSDNGLNKAAYDNNHSQDNSKLLVSAKDLKLPTKSLVQNTKLEQNLYQQSHLQIPTTVTISPKPLEKNNEGYRQVLLPKPIISQYLYKQINNNMPDKFTIVQVGENPKFYRDITSEKIIDVTPYPILPSTVSMPTDYVYIPPNITTRKPIVNKSLQTESDISLQDVSKHEDVNIDTITSEENVVTITKHKEDMPPSETIVTSSDNSLNANPIVVPDEPTYSFIQERQDGSVVKTVADNKNVWSIQSTTINSLHRGDIPEPVF